MFDSGFTSSALLLLAVLVNSLSYFSIAPTFLAAIFYVFYICLRLTPLGWILG